MAFAAFKQCIMLLLRTLRTMMKWMMETTEMTTLAYVNPLSIEMLVLMV